MKTRILIAFALLALVMAFAYTASAPAAPHKTGANAVPVHPPTPTPQRQPRRSGIRRFARPLPPSGAPSNTSSTQPTISAAIASKPFGQLTRQFTSLRSASSTTKTNPQDLLAISSSVRKNCSAGRCFFSFLGTTTHFPKTSAVA